MKIHSSQSGFTPIHLLLLLVLAGIIGFVGWRVYDASKKPDTSSNPATPQASVNSEPKIPDGFVEYENKTHGIKFVYPQEWGKANEQPLEPSDPKFEAEYGNRNPLVELKFGQLGSGTRMRIWTKENARISTSANAPSNCSFNAGTDSWEPTAGSYATNESCNRTRRKSGAISVYGFTRGALGAYAYIEVFELNDRFIELSETADFEKDFQESEQFAEPDLKPEAVTRIKGFVTDAVDKLIQGNKK